MRETRDTFSCYSAPLHALPCHKQLCHQHDAKARAPLWQHLFLYQVGAKFLLFFSPPQSWVHEKHHTEPGGATQTCTPPHTAHGTSWGAQEKGLQVQTAQSPHLLAMGSAGWRPCQPVLRKAARSGARRTNAMEVAPGRVCYRVLGSTGGSSQPCPTSTYLASCRASCPPCALLCSSELLRERIKHL